LDAYADVGGVDTSSIGAMWRLCCQCQAPLLLVTGGAPRVTERNDSSRRTTAARARARSCVAGASTRRGTRRACAVGAGKVQTCCTVQA
jgi:hypothetical protein